MYTITVTNLNDSGAGSLHQALTDASSYTSTDEVEIVFDMSLAGTITLGSNLKIPAKVTVQLPESVKLNLNSRDLLIYGNLTADNESAVDSIFSTSTSAQVIVYSGGKMSLTKTNIALPASQSVQINEGGTVELAECEIDKVVQNRGNLKADNCTFNSYVEYDMSTGSLSGNGNTFAADETLRLTNVSGDTVDLLDFIGEVTENAYIGLSGSMYDCTLADVFSVVPQGYKLSVNTTVQSGYTVTLEEGVRLNLDSCDLLIYGNLTADNQSSVDSIFSTSTSAQVIVYSGGKMSLTKANIALPASQSVQINGGGTVELAECDIDGDVKNAGDLKANNCTFKSYVTNNGSLQADNSTFHSPIIFNSSTWSMGGSGNEFTQPEAFRLQTGFGGDTSFMKTFVKTAPEDAYVGMLGSMYDCTLADIRSVIPGGYKFIGTTEIRSGYTMTLLEGALIDDNDNHFDIYGTLKAEFDNVTDAIRCSRYIEVDNGGTVILKNANVVDCNGDWALIEVQDSNSSWTMEGGSLAGDFRAFYGATITLTNVTFSRGYISCREDSYIDLDGVVVTEFGSISNSGTMTIKNTRTDSWIYLYEGSSTVLENVTCETLYIAEIKSLTTSGAGVTLTAQRAMVISCLTGDLLSSLAWNATAEDACVSLTGVISDCILSDISSKCAGGYQISGSVYGNVVVEAGVSIADLSSLSVYGTFKVENESLVDAINPDNRKGYVTIYSDGRVILKNSNVSLNSIRVNSGGALEMNGGTLDAAFDVSEGSVAQLDSVRCGRSVSVAGSMTVDSCVFDESIILHSGAVLTGSDNIFAEEEIFKVKEADGDVSAFVAQLEKSQYAKDNPYVSIDSFAEGCNVTLNALTGGLKKYVIRRDYGDYYSDTPYIDESGVLNIGSGAVVEVIGMECEGTINCEAGAVFDTEGLVLKGTLNCDRRLFDGQIALGAGALLCGNGNTIAADMRFVLSDWSGEVADAFAGLSGTVLEDGMPAIHVQSISGAAILGHINNQDTTYVLESSDLEAGLVVQDGVILRCAVGDTYVYGNLALSGAVKIETSEGWVTDYYDGGGSTRRGLYVSDGASLTYDTLTVDGTLILNEGAAVSGSNLVLMGKESLGIVVSGWDGSAPDVMENLGDVVTAHDDACLLYQIDGLGGNSVTISKKSQQSLAGAVFESVLFDEVMLYEGDILTIGADAPVTVGTLLQVQEGATLNLQSGARLKVEKEPESNDGYYYEGTGSVVGIQICENSTVNLGGKVYIDGDVHIWPGAEINGGELVLMGDSRIVLHDWSGSTDSLDSMVSGKISYENSTPNPVEISFGSSDGASVTLAELKNGQTDYYCGNGYAYGTSLTLEEGVSLHFDEHMDLYSYGEEEDTTPTLTMKKGSTISGSRENADLRLNQGLSGIDCTINATLCLDGILSGQGIKLTAERAVEFNHYVEGADTYGPVYSFEEMFGNADYECTHGNAYAVCWLSTAYGTDAVYNIDAAFMAAHTPVGCKQLVFSGYTSDVLFRVDSGITLGIEELALSGNSRVVFGKDCVVVGYDRDEPSYLNVCGNSVIVADNTTFQTTLHIDDTTSLQGTGYLFDARNAVNYRCDLSRHSLADVKHVFDGVDYTVLRDDAIFGLALTLAGDENFYFTQNDLDALAPAGFAEVALSGLDGWSFEGTEVVLDGVEIQPHSTIGGGDFTMETLKVLNTTLHSDVYISGWGLGNLVLDNIELNGGEIVASAENTVISNCSGTGVLSIGGPVTVRNCDLSQIEVMFSEWFVSTGTVDLSGNYWGTTDINAILEHFESAPSGLNVVIDDVLADPPAGVGFTFAASISSGLKLEPSEKTLTLTFTAQIDADSAGMGSVVLRDAAGRVMEIDSILVKGDRLVLNLTEPFEAGEYKVSVNAGLKDTDGNAFVAPVVNPELKVTVEKDSQVRVLKTLFNESVGSLDSVDIYLGGSSVVDPELLVEAVSLVAEDGTVYDAIRVETVIDGLLYRAIFDGKQPTGQYDFVIKDDVAITSRGDKLGSSFQQTLYISSPDLEVVSQHLQLFARANEQDKQMKVTYQVVNNGEEIKFRDRVDTLFVCETAEWDASAARAVSRKLVDSTILAGGQVEYSFSYDLDDRTIGKKFYLFVRTDSREDVAETDEQNNISCIGEITIVADEWNIRGTELNLELGSTAYYEWVAEADGSYLLGVTSADCRVQASVDGWNGLYGSPSAAHLLESEGKQYWYLNARAGQTYQLAMTALQEINDLTCVTVAAPASVHSIDSLYVDPTNNCITVRGINLQQLDNFKLVHQDGQEIYAAEINVIDTGTLEVRFNLDSVQMEGEYFLTWENESGTAASLQQAIQYMPPFLESVFVKQHYGFYIREGTCVRMQVRTENTAGGAARAPLVLVREGVEKEILYYGEVKSVDVGKLQGRKALLFLADSEDDTPGYLKSGEGYTFTFTERTASDNPATYTEVFNPGDATVLSESKWGWIESALRPEGMSDADWNAWWGNMQPRIGRTVDDFVQFVYSMRDALQAAGRSVGYELCNMTAAIMEICPDFAPSAATFGVLTNGMGLPAEAEIVSLYAVVNGERILIDTTLTDANGRFAFGHLQNGQEYEVVTSRSFLLNGEKSNSFSFVQNGMTTRHELQSPAAAPVSLVLTGLSESAASSAVVYLKAEDGNTVFLTFWSGKWVADEVELGDYTLVARADGYWFNPSQIKVTAEGISDFELAAVPSSTLSGRLLNAGGTEGIEGVYILLCQGGKMVNAAVTDVDGSYTLPDVAAGTYTLLLNDMSGRVIAEVSHAGTPLVIEDVLMNQGNTVNGTLRGAPSLSQVALYQGESCLYTANVKADGSYTFTGVKSGKYRLLVNGSEVDPSFTLDLTEDESAVSLAAMTVMRGARIAATLTEMDMDTLFLYRDGQLISVASVSESGAYGFTVSEIGDYEIQAFNSVTGCMSERLAVKVTSLSDNITPSLVSADGTLNITGTASRLSGDAICVIIYRNGEDSQVVRTLQGDEIIGASIEGLATGIYDVVVVDNNASKEYSISLNKSQSHTVTIGELEQRCSINLSLTDSGELFLDESVSVYLYNKQTGMLSTSWNMKAGESYTGSGIIEGVYDLVAITDDNKGYARGQVEISKGETNSFSMGLSAMSNTITGTVTGLECELCEGATVKLYDEDGYFVSYATVLEDGTYSLLCPESLSSGRVVASHGLGGLYGFTILEPGNNVCDIQVRQISDCVAIDDQVKAEDVDVALFAYDNPYMEMLAGTWSRDNGYIAFAGQPSMQIMSRVWSTVLKQAADIIYNDLAPRLVDAVSSKCCDTSSLRNLVREQNNLYFKTVNAHENAREACQEAVDEAFNIVGSLSISFLSAYAAAHLGGSALMIAMGSSLVLAPLQSAITMAKEFADSGKKVNRENVVEFLRSEWDSLLSMASDIGKFVASVPVYRQFQKDITETIDLAKCLDMYLSHDYESLGFESDSARLEQSNILAQNLRLRAKKVNQTINAYPELADMIGETNVKQFKTLEANATKVEFGTSSDRVQTLISKIRLNVDVDGIMKTCGTVIKVLSVLDTFLTVLSGAQFLSAVSKAEQAISIMKGLIDQTDTAIDNATVLLNQVLVCIDAMGEDCYKPDDPKQDKLPKETKKAWDPNDITGPAGVGEQNWVADGVQKYIIQCENDAEKAFAHAARVVITQQLDSDLDWSTFRIGTMNMGGYYIEVPEEMSEYRARLDWRETHGLYVDVDVSLDYATGVVTWSFTSIDPETEDIPVSPDMGLLAPNFNPPEGDGWVEYSIQPKAGAETGAKVEAQATFVFDWNDPIDTPYIFNTLDKSAPTAAMVTQTRRIDARRYAVSWQGQDEESGIASYDVYVSCDDGEWELWASDIKATTAVYTADSATHEYRFRVVAKDNVGNVQTEAGDALKLSHDSSKGAPEVMALAATTDPATGFVTGFTATFNVSMNLAAQLKDGSLASLVTLVHTQAGAVNMSDGTFSYDSVTKTLSWKSNTPLRAGEYRLTVQPGALKSSSGVALGAPVIPGFSVRHLMQTVGSYSAPTVADVNGDGLVDLLIGEKTTVDSGSVRLHINVGTAEQPEFGAGQYISTPQGLLTVEATGCLGAAPAVADINGDGLADLLIGKADGTIQLYIQEQPGAEGDGPIWSDYGRIKGIDVGERATPVQADWNSDGRPDLLVGNADGNIVLYLNIGTAEVPTYDSGRYLYDGGSLLSVPEGRSSFVVGDWDGDSLPDIISGNTAGQLVYYHNYGTEGNPLFAGYELLHADGGIFDLPNSPRSRLAAMDWNGDGVLDLVVGAEDGNLHLLSGEKNSAGVAGYLGVEGHPNLDDKPSGSQVLQLSGAYDGSGIYSATVQDNLSSTDRTDYFSLHATADGAFNMALDTSKLDAAVRLSVGVLDGDGLFSVSQELLLTPGAAVDSLPGVAISAGEQLYIRVESVDASSETNYELSLTGTVPSVGSNLATQNNSAAEATELSSPSAAVTGWVGAGDACDFYRVEMAAAGSLSIGLDELEAAARVRVYEQRADGSLAQLDSRAVKAASGLDATLSLTSGTYFVEVASLDAGAGQYNTAYSLTLEKEQQQAAEEAQECFSNLA